MAKKTEWVLVETVEMFRMRYCVEVPAGKKEYALDTVTMREAKEFSQEWKGETIISSRVVTEKEALKIYDEDNPSFKGWTKAQKINSAFTREGEKAE